MSRLLEAIHQSALTRPDALALQAGNRSVSYAELVVLVETLAAQLTRYAPRVLGLLADNGIDWVLADLAALQSGITVVPLPTYFSSAQLRHAIRSAGIDRVLTDQPADLCALTGFLVQDEGIFHGSLHGVRVEPSGGGQVCLPAGTQKISFTSGTTGAPKGVCLSIASMEHVALSLLGATAASLEDRHLCVLPLATLLENIAGVYVPLMAGATCLLPPLAHVGLSGSSGLDVGMQLSALDGLRATSAILVPQMLAAEVAAISTGAPRPRALRYLAVGGGSVSPRLVAHAISLGLPVHEGYGLSECASVVALNRPEDNRPGSVGKPLPHVRVDIAAGGEIVVYGAQFEGYLGALAQDPKRPLHTGDLGHLDDDGFLYVTGRKKNVFITSFGRNLSPEWIERELLAQQALFQVAVFGEAQPFNVAVIVPHPAMTTAAISSAIAAANAALPDYARVAHWVIARSPFTRDNGQLTHNGRPRRTEIAAAYSTKLECLYQKESLGVLCSIA